MRTGASTILVLLLVLPGARPGAAEEPAVRLLASSPGVRRGTAATIRYVVEKPVQSMGIEVVDDQGRVAARFSSVSEESEALGHESLALAPGEHAIAWDLRHACGTAFADLESLADIRDMEPFVAPGSFEVRLVADGVRLSSPLVVTLNPRIAATHADLDAQLKFALEMCDRRRTALSAVARLHKAAESLRGWIASADGEETRAVDQQMLRSLTEFTAGILAPGGTVGAGALPWAERLAALQRQVAAADRRPTEAEWSAYRAFDAELAQLLRNEPALDTPASIEFDSKGLDFGAWLRAFIAAVRSHWLVPPGLAGERGRVAISFSVTRSGAIEEVKIEEPSRIEAFNGVSRRAILEASPAPALPKGYPADRCFFTVNFFYNLVPRH